MAQGRIPEEQARVDIYRLLALLLAAPPSADLLAMTRDIHSAEGNLASVWQDLRQEAAMTDPPALECEYHDLFIGLGRGELNPYASWYLTGFLMEKPLADLRGELSVLGLARRPGVPEPEDHVAALCETMAIMLADGSWDDTVCERFFRSYLGSWMERFFEDLQGANGARFYRAVGRLGSAFMEIEQQYYAMPA
jgi:TorA maturation chaperone TorD